MALTIFIMTPRSPVLPWRRTQMRALGYVPWLAGPGWCVGATDQPALPHTHLDHPRGPVSRVPHCPHFCLYRALVLLALICQWASAQAKDSAGIRPGSQTLNWSWAFHYHTPVPQQHMVRGK